MAQVMQATCPGCKAVLRIPAEWMGQSIRCKSCGAQVQTKAPSSPSRKAVPPPPPLAKAPPPPPRPTAVAVATDSAFDFDEAEIDAPSRRGGRRGKGGHGAWIALVFLLLLVAGAGGAVYMFRDKIAQAVRDPDSLAGGGRKEKEKPAPAATGPFPRRALVISVHNYLYANPLPAPSKDDEGIRKLLDALREKLKIDAKQIVHLSDAAEKEPRPPLKSVIREGLTNFLKTSRAQDRVLVFFVGHTAEVNGEVYLVPLEGELTAAKNLIPLKEVLAEMAKCPARQKVLVLDGNRYNPSQGEERPTSGPMGEKLEALLKAPPAGVEVVAACSKGQRSYEFADASLGAFLTAFRMALTPREGEKGAVDGKIQARDDLIPLEALHKAINTNLARIIEANAPQEGEGEKKHKATQVALLAGKAPAQGAAYDPNEAAAQAPAIPTPKLANAALVKEIMSEISLPPLKGGEGSALDVDADQLPPFPEAAMKKYEAGDLPEGSAVRKAVREARVLIWALSSSSPPADLAAEVKEVRDKLGTAERMMRREVTKAEASNKPALDKRLEDNGRRLAPIIARMERVKEKLDEAVNEAKEAPPRWQATFSLVRGRFNAQLAYLEEYANVIGQMRKELPPAEANHSGWRIAAKKKAGDSAGRKYDKQAQTLFKAVSSEHAETPWDVMARREMINNLGLEWQAY